MKARLFDYIRRPWIVSIFVILIFSCSIRADENPADIDSNLIGSINEFGFELFKNLNDSVESGSNILISPFSLHVALSIACNGAKNETYDEMAKALKIDNYDINGVNEFYRELFQTLIGSDSLIDFTTANSLWIRWNKAIVPAFLNLCSDYYDADIKEFKPFDSKAVDSINHWVNEKTKGKITKIIQPPISKDTALIMLNAIYFKGNWTFKFDTTDTRTMPFYLDDNRAVDCEMMFKESEEHTTQINMREVIDNRLKYCGHRIFQAVDLPYGDAGFRITLFLPDSLITVDSLISYLNTANWNTWRTQFYTTRFTIGLPKFKFSFSSRLNENLINMGMEKAFDTLADFSGMFVDKKGWIHKVIHKSFVQVDEEGTEAAAATMIMFADSLPYQVILNRPFLFVIHDVDTGAILFVGKVANPVWES